jgi:hypothetical protein
MRTLPSMSIPVPLAELAKTMAGYPLGYLLTVSDGERVHAVQVSAAVYGERLRVPRLGRRSLTNVAQQSLVTLLWPPTEDGGYSLIVDGEAEVVDDGVLVTPSRAVLHRAAAVPQQPADDGACVSDCVELPLG